VVMPLFSPATACTQTARETRSNWGNEFCDGQRPPLQKKNKAPANWHSILFHLSLVTIHLSKNASSLMSTYRWRVDRATRLQHKASFCLRSFASFCVPSAAASSTAIEHFSEPFFQGFAALQRLVEVFFGKCEDLHRPTGNDGRIAWCSS